MFCIAVTQSGHKMPNRCVAAGCSNIASAEISLFKFRSDSSLRKQWEKQVQRTRVKWKATDHSFLCSVHFAADCFEAEVSLASQFGIAKRRRLKPAAVPSIFSRVLASSASGEIGGKSAPRKRTVQAVFGDNDAGPSRGAAKKRKRREVW